MSKYLLLDVVQIAEAYAHYKETELITLKGEDIIGEESSVKRKNAELLLQSIKKLREEIPIDIRPYLNISHSNLDPIEKKCLECLSESQEGTRAKSVSSKEGGLEIESKIPT